jgi:hypothetical protein
MITEEDLPEYFNKLSYENPFEREELLSEIVYFNS